MLVMRRNTIATTARASDREARVSAHAARALNTAVVVRPESLLADRDTPPHPGSFMELVLPPPPSRHEESNFTENWNKIEAAPSPSCVGERPAQREKVRLTRDEVC
jgi:hypothetical protein